jgi:NAD(P)-dependent dehydrogenase (short-subunit alcohol dehydrogenase family)
MAREPAPVVVVTGASRGIGAATATLAAARGYAVAVNYRSDEPGAARTVSRIVEAGGTAAAIRADVSRAGEVASLFDEAERSLGPVDALVNNAGVAGRHARLDLLAPDELRAVFDVNLLGAMLCAREAIRRMTPRGGAVVNVSSTAAIAGGASGLVAYAASKAAIEAMTVGLAREAGPHGVRVNAVRPGMIDTAMNAFDADPVRRQAMADTVPLRRIGTPDEVAAAIVWLLSKEASYVNGAIVAVSGGR